MTPRWFWAALVLATVVLAWPLALPVVYDTHDGHYVFYNAAQFDRALRDGQVPVRWLPDLHGGRGIPFFVFYHPLVFYALSALHAVGLGFIAATKLLYVLTVPLSGLAALAWLRRHLPVPAAALGAVAYTTAPFRAVEIHVKGDPPAALAYVFLPLVFLGIVRCLRAERGGILVLSLASAALVLAHAITALLVVPVALLLLLMLLPEREKRGVRHLLVSLFLGAALSCWHWLPAWVEREWVRIDSPEGILFFDWREHFLAAWQWISPLWGYHGSFAGTGDAMAFQVGPVHAAGMLAAAWALWRLRRRDRLAWWAAIVAVGALLLTLPVSRPLWSALPLLRYVQFPWRLLALVVPASAVLLAWAASAAPRRLLLLSLWLPVLIPAVFALVQRNAFYAAIAALAAAVALAAWLLFLRWGRREELIPPLVAGLLLVATLPWTAVPLHARLKGEPAVVAIGEADLTPGRVRLGIRRTTARWDYLPRTVREVPLLDPAQEYLAPPDARPPADLEVLDGTLTRAEVRRGSDRFVLEYEAPSAARVALNLHAFPGWEGPGDALDAEGRIVALLPAGSHRVEWRYGRTPDRKWAEIVSLLAVVALLGLLTISVTTQSSVAPGTARTSTSSR